MSAPQDDDFFIGWTAPSGRDRRFFLAAAAGTILAGGGLAAALARAQQSPGAGAWDQGAVRTWRGYLIREPYPMLRTRDLDGAPRTAFLGTSGKLGVGRRLPDRLEGPVSVRASLIARDAHAMLAVADGADWIAPAALDAEGLDIVQEEDRGEAFLVGEILDAKCWFGAMRPGFGKTHKACAALCARGGLPLAFCELESCGLGGVAPLFLDGAGRAHGRTILPLVGDPVSARGRLVQAGDVLQFRVDARAIKRL